MQNRTNKIYLLASSRTSGTADETTCGISTDVCCRTSCPVHRLPGPQAECHLYKYRICNIIFTADVTYKLLTRGAENLLDLLRWELRKLFGHDWVSKSALICGTEERNRLSDLWHVIQNDRFQTGVGASECASEHGEIRLEVRTSVWASLTWCWPVFRQVSRHVILQEDWTMETARCKLSWAPVQSFTSEPSTHWYKTYLHWTNFLYKTRWNIMLLCTGTVGYLN